MKNVNLSKNLSLILLGFVTIVLRFYKLGDIPEGISVEEASFGLLMSKYFADWVLNPFIIRLPSAVLSTLSVFVFYFLLRRISDDDKFSYLSSLLLAVTPWYIQEGRILSFGILSSFILLILLSTFSSLLKSRVKLLTSIFFILSVFLFAVAILNSYSNAGEAVDLERQFGTNVVPLNLTKIFSNKVIESYRNNLSKIYEQLDFGVYFFSGHPRQGWGVEETQKLFISFIPFIFVGMVKAKRSIKPLLDQLFFFAVTLFTFMNLRGPSQTIPLVFIFVFFAGNGLACLLEKKKHLALFLLLIALAYEFLSFNSLYFSGLTESTFSPRRPIYVDITKRANNLARSDENVLVSERLINPKIYFQFYLKDRQLSNFEFREYNVWNESDKSALFVDVLPYEPSPSEPLYTVEGNLPEKLRLLYETKDDQLKQRVFIYRYDES